MAEVPIIEKAMAAAMSFFMTLVPPEISLPCGGHEEKLPLACRTSMPGSGQLVTKCIGVSLRAPQIATKLERSETGCRPCGPASLKTHLKNSYCELISIMPEDSRQGCGSGQPFLHGVSALIRSLLIRGAYLLRFGWPGFAPRPLPDGAFPLLARICATLAAPVRALCLCGPRRSAT